jgi:CheY-like chemotaxis protein
VHEASDGREALAKAITMVPDVIVSESRLPGMSGYDLCSLLRRDAATNAIPFVFVIGEAIPGDLARANTAGADIVLPKPCLPEQLFASIVQLRLHSRNVRDRATTVRSKAVQQLARADELLRRSADLYSHHRTTLKAAHQRGDTMRPPLRPPELLCPSCDGPLHYERSHIGGVSSKHAEQWDYFLCPRGCGTFQYRERTRKLRSVG